MEDPLDVYRREVAKIPPLDAAEEAICVEHVRASDEMAEVARQRLVEANLYRVIELAEHYQNESSHLLDLIEQGNNGLLAAANELSQVADCPFWEFASVFVKSSLEEHSQRHKPE